MLLLVVPAAWLNNEAPVIRARRRIHHMFILFQHYTLKNFLNISKAQYTDKELKLQKALKGNFLLKLFIYRLYFYDFVPW